MEIQKAAEHCEKAWEAHAKKNNITRTDEFYLFKMQEELGELVRSYMVLNGNEHEDKSREEMQKKFQGDCASLVGNALILALHFGVKIEDELLRKFPI
jgi:hypothetical protein